MPTLKKTKKRKNPKNDHSRFLHQQRRHNNTNAIRAAVITPFFNTTEDTSQQYNTNSL